MNLLFSNLRESYKFLNFTCLNRIRAKNYELSYTVICLHRHFNITKKLKSIDLVRLVPK